MLHLEFDLLQICVRPLRLLWRENYLNSCKVIDFSKFDTNFISICAFCSNILLFQDEILRTEC